MRKSTKIKVAIGAAVGLVALTAGSAFTAGNTLAPGVANPVVGYASTNVSGATINSMEIRTNSTGDELEAVVVVLAGDTTASNVKMSIEDLGATACDQNSAPGGVETFYFCYPPTGFPTEALTKVSFVVN